MKSPVVTNPPAPKAHWVGCLALAVLIVAVFWPVLTFDFVRWDDDINITQNPLLTAPWSWTLVGQLFDGAQAMRFEPLHWLCYRLLHAAFGFNPAGWHAFSLGLHVLVAILFYLVLRRVCLLLLPGPAGPNVALGAWLGAALWALHPLRAEAVAWVTASTYPLTAAGLLASFACYLQAHACPARRRRWLGLAWLFAVAAYSSYPAGLAYGLWLMATDRWLLPAEPDKNGSWAAGFSRAWCVKHACFLAPAALALVPTLWSRLTTPGIFTSAPTVESVGLLSRAEMALASLTALVQGLLWPVDLTPNLPPFEPGARIQLKVAVMALAALLVLAVAWRGRQRHPGRALLWLGFAALALPCLGWTERPKWPDDRYSYLAHLALIGGATVWLLRGAGGIRPRRLALGALAVTLVLGSAWAARRQIMIWQDSSALFTHTERHPHFADSPRQQAHVYMMWASYEVTAAQPAEAARLFNRAQQVYLSAIQAAVAQQDYPEALVLSAGLEHDFALTPVMRRERGYWLLLLGRRPEALAELQAAQSALPDDARVKALIKEAKK